MIIIGEDELEEFARRHLDAKEAILAWMEDVRGAEWHTPEDVRRYRPKVRRLPSKRFMFNILRNRYRLMVQVDYKSGTVDVQFIGTHARYERVRPWRTRS